MQGRHLITATVFAAALLAARAPDAFAQDSLYKRLGGYDAIAAVTDDFVGRLLGDERFATFFVGHGDASKGRIRQLVVDQLCAATGGPCIYIGRDMRSVHQGLGITEDDWSAAVAHLTASLDKFEVGETEKSEVLGALGPLKADIVQAPGSTGRTTTVRSTKSNSDC